MSSRQKLRPAPVEFLVYAAMALMFVGLGFKVAAAPFHVWTPDVYEGAPAPVVGFMSTAPKAAAFAVLLRVVFSINAPGRFWLSVDRRRSFHDSGQCWRSCAKQREAHAGLFFDRACGIHTCSFCDDYAADSTIGISAVMFYTASYAAMNVGAFAVVSHFANAGERYVTLEDYEGLGRTSPLLAATLTIFLLSLIGIPMTGGFFAKFYVFSAAVRAEPDLAYSDRHHEQRRSALTTTFASSLRCICERRQRSPGRSDFLRAGSGACDQQLLATIYLGVLPDRVLQLLSSPRRITDTAISREHQSQNPQAVEPGSVHLALKFSLWKNRISPFDKTLGHMHHVSTRFQIQFFPLRN